MTWIITSNAWLWKWRQILILRSHSWRKQLKELWEWGLQRKKARTPEGISLTHPCLLSAVSASPGLGVIHDRPHVHPSLSVGKFAAVAATSTMAPAMMLPAGHSMWSGPLTLNVDSTPYSLWQNMAARGGASCDENVLSLLPLLLTLTLVLLLAHSDSHVVSCPMEPFMWLRTEGNPWPIACTELNPANDYEGELETECPPRA